jgi:hypothetical protein
MKWQRHCALVAAGTLLSLGAATGVQAQQTWSGDGNSLLAPLAVEEYQLPDGRMVRAMSFQGFTVSEDKESPFHLASQDCKGTYVFEADGESFTAAGRLWCDGRRGQVRGHDGGRDLDGQDADAGREDRQLVAR